MRAWWPVRILVLVIIEVFAIIALIVFAATVAIPLTAPRLATPTQSLSGSGDCPRTLPGCR